MKTQQPTSPLARALAGAALGLALAACGVGGLGPTAAGRAQTEVRIAGTVTLVDSSLPVQSRGAPMDGDGAYAVQVAGLQPPFLLRVAWADASGPQQLYGISEDGGNVDVNGFTDVAYRSACVGEPEERLFLESSADRKREAVVQARSLLTTLGTALAPLFERYAIADPWTDRDEVRVLLQDVAVVRAGDALRVVNRVTEDAIFEGPVGDLASGTFVAAGMPPGPGIPTCTAFTYADYGACRPDGTSTRAVLGSDPPGCQGGKPETTQACVYVPPRSICTVFTYTAYGACRPDGTSTRAVLTSAPAGCVGGTPETTRACLYEPPRPTCTSFSYSDWGRCKPDGTRTRTVRSARPAGCTGGTPVTTQTCKFKELVSESP
jgi:hypothetical protein